MASLEQSLSSLPEVPYLMVDMMATLTNRKFAKDLDAVLRRSKESGVQKIVVRATNCQTSREALRLCRLFPETLFCCAGVTPHESKLWTEDSESQLTDLVRNSECVAIGECGLDFGREFGSPRVTQLEVLEKVMTMSCQLKSRGLQRPLVVVCRDAHSELRSLLREYASRDLPQVVIRAFNGSHEEAVQYVSFGCYFAVNGLVTKDKSENGVRRLLQNKTIALNRLMVESDSPWSFPNARASRLPDAVKSALTDRSLGLLNRYCTFQRNEPCSLATTMELIAALMDVRAEEVALQTTYNCLKVFGLTV